ncbi:phage tail protein [Oxalobacter vibrioformis]|uniref:Phage tail protein n=1 Tax=Oxalobacter vibrioformis TaxID=933080 RepID=A0A9E9P336_9BURK|nr:phage tail protein [Oxalobacter vibrioformis]WAW09810.1 phage tail protein [Oxalobacter vibrioformis]
MVPLLSWLYVHQIELLSNPDRRKTGIRFEADFNNRTMDISIELDLTEKVIVREDEKGKLSARHQQEPQFTPDYTDKFWQLYKGDDLLAEWYTDALKKP